jgi:hypothetical protein
MRAQDEPCEIMSVKGKRDRARVKWWRSAAYDRRVELDQRACVGTPDQREPSEPATLDGAGPRFTWCAHSIRISAFARSAVNDH